MTKLSIIGIGPGDSRYATVEAVEAIAALDVVIVLDKGSATAELVAVRKAALDRFSGTQPPRLVEIADPVRDHSLPYGESVSHWHQARVDAVSAALATVGADDHVGILAWGDPSLYDSTIRIVEAVAAGGGCELDWSVVPGVTSPQLLASRHRISLNRIGRAVLITTGRRLRDDLPEGIDDAVVMLDGDCAFRGLVGHGFEIYWGAYLGSDDEMLLAGPLDLVADAIVSARAEARERKGWIFDIYLLRRLDRS